MRRLAACAWPLIVAVFVARTAADDPKPAEKPPARTLGVLLYPGYEPLDAWGPIEMFGNVGRKLKVVTVAEKAGEIRTSTGQKSVADYSLADCPELQWILVPGGNGTLTEVKNETLLAWLKDRGEKAELVMSVCSGSAILARAGLLDERKATSNKLSFDYLVNYGPKTEWIRKARWVDDGNRVTSSGVSAGMDMALHVINRYYGEKVAEGVARGTEYRWHREADDDPFAGEQPEAAGR